MSLAICGANHWEHAMVISGADHWENAMNLDLVFWGADSLRTRNEFSYFGSRLLGKRNDFSYCWNRSPLENAMNLVLLEQIAGKTL